MFDRFLFWTPLLVLFSIIIDAISHSGDNDYVWMAITASIGWMMYWDALNDLRGYEKDDSNA